MKRRWTLETARELVGEVRSRTARAVATVESLEARIEVARREGQPARELALELRACISRWMREMEAFGLRVRGPWEVEFESEAGAFCWKWPERALTRFRGSDGADATRIQ